jgi:hypothetical protein
MTGPWLRILNRCLGVSRVRYPISGATRDALTFLGVLLLKGVCHRLGVAFRGRTSLCGGPHFGELSGGNWMTSSGLLSLGGVGWGLNSGPRPIFLPSDNFCPSFLGSVGGDVGPLVASRPLQDSYLVDSASSHMLVSKIKPCMSKYKHLYRETANGSLNQL